MRWILTLAIAAATGACDGTPVEPCHTADDCASGLSCAGPNDRQVCGVPPREQCTDDSQCTGGDRCHVVLDACSPDGFGSECRSPCTETTCGAGLRCEAGACIAIRCDEPAGTPCPEPEVCWPWRITPTTPVYDRSDACFAIECTSDSGCGDYPCVNGICQIALGVCRVPELVP